MSNWIEKIIDESIDTKKSLKNIIPMIEKIGNTIYESLNNNGTIFFIGNGGSAADSQHIAAEFVGKYQIKRDGLAAIALTTNSSIITAIGNDFGYDYVFQRQVESLVKTNDVLIGISTSGNSKNILNAIHSAKIIGAKTIGLTGNDGGELSKLVDLALKVPSESTQRIQESHILIGHILCDIVENKLSQ